MTVTASYLIRYVRRTNPMQFFYTSIFYVSDHGFARFSKRRNDYGSGLPNVSDNFLTIEIPLPLPPLPEQHRIVAKIEELFTKLDAGINALHRVQAQLKRYRQSVLKAAFEGKLTEAWRAEHQDEIEPASVLLKRVLKARRKKYGGRAAGKQMKAKVRKSPITLTLQKWKSRYKEPAAPDDERSCPSCQRNLGLGNC